MAEECYYNVVVRDKFYLPGACIFCSTTHSHFPDICYAHTSYNYILQWLVILDMEIPLS